MRSKGHRTTIWLLHIITLWHVLVFVHMLNASCNVVTFILRRRRTLGSVESERAAGVVRASDTLAMVEHVPRVPGGFDC